MKKLSWALAATAIFAAAPALAQQASLNLDGSSMIFCNTVNNTWGITKTVNHSTVTSGGSVTWTVNVTKNGPDGDAPPPVFCVEGKLIISNSGAVPATVGNIVINLQRQYTISGKKRWVGVSADVADKTSHDGATQALVVAAATQEDAGWNSSVNPSRSGLNQTYTVSGTPTGSGRFSENAASGTLLYFDADGNDVTGTFGYVIPAYATGVELNYRATFDMNALSAGEGGAPDHLRAEALVTFGNAGGRGGSGASIDNIDIDGDGSVTLDPVIDSESGEMIGGGERHVRTVPVRASLPVPAVEQCNPEVTLTDLLRKVSGTVTWQITGGDIVPDGSPMTVTGTESHTLITKLTGTVGSKVGNKATITGTESGCCEATDESTPEVVVTIIGCTNCNQDPCPCGGVRDENGRCPPCASGYCTFSQGGYQGGGVPGDIFQNNFAAQFPSGMIVGDYNTAGGNAAPNGAKFTATSGGMTALTAYLAGGGPSGEYTNDYLDANPIGSGGALGKQLAALKLNVAFSGVMPIPSGNLGNAMICAIPGNLSGVCPTAQKMTVNAFIALADDAIANGNLPIWLGFDDIKTIAENLNLSFHNDQCTASAWALTNILTN
jgi:hypothetical protein